MIAHIFGCADDAAQILWQCCENCGAEICLGERYYMHEGLRICSGCVHRYAWAVFEAAAACTYAAPDTPLYLPP